MTMESTLEQEATELQQGPKRVQREIEEAGKKLKNGASDVWNDATEMVKKHPGQALGIALVAGVAAGILAAGVSRKPYSASDNLRNLAGSGTEAWKKIREGFDEALCTMKESFEDAAAKFK